jgi:uncharacterized protein (DUF2141 family)
MFKLIFAAFTTCIAAAAVPAGAADLTIAIDGVASAGGKVMVALYDSTGPFPGKPMRAAAVPATAGAVQVQIKDLPAGDYAFAVYHDANDNGKLDRNAVGMPVEDYAFSNNALGKHGPPAFADARFAVPAAGATARVNLR